MHLWARLEFQKAVHLNPGNEFARKKLDGAGAENKKSGEDAKKVEDEYRNRQQKASKPLAAAFIELSEWAMNQGLTAEARLAYGRALDYDPDNATARGAYRVRAALSRWLVTGAALAHPPQDAPLGQNPLADPPPQQRLVGNPKLLRQALRLADLPLGQPNRHEPLARSGPNALRERTSHGDVDPPALRPKVRKVVVRPESRFLAPGPGSRTSGVWLSHHLLHLLSRRRSLSVMSLADTGYTRP